MFNSFSREGFLDDDSPDDDKITFEEMVNTFKDFLAQKHYEQFFEKIFCFRNDEENDELDLEQDEREERIL